MYQFIILGFLLSLTVIIIAYPLPVVNTFLKVFLKNFCTYNFDKVVRFYMYNLKKGILAVGPSVLRSSSALYKV